MGYRAHAAIVSSLMVAGSPEGKKIEGVSRETVRKKKFKYIQHRGKIYPSKKILFFFQNQIYILSKIEYNLIYLFTNIYYLTLLIKFSLLTCLTLKNL